MRAEVLDSALAALEYWAAAPGDHPSFPATPAIERARRAAWLLMGDPPAPDRWPALPQGPLVSVFARVRGVNTTPLLRPVSLRLEREALFPVADDAPAVGLVGDAPGRLAAELAALEHRDLPAEARLEALLYALQRHAWSLPSPIAGVSRYDFARVNAALAAALAGAPEGQVCLIAGDVSGVQDFIYSVTARGAARQLRGRSFYLQLLTDACAHATLHATGMPLCNLLYAGGGRLYVLAPAAARERVPELRRQIAETLYRAHRGALYLALGAVAFRPEEYSAALWEQVGAELDRDKRRRFAALDRETFAALFAARQPAPPSLEHQEDEPLDTMGASLEELGRQVQRAALIAFQPEAPRPLVGSEQRYDQVLAALGLRARLIDNVERLAPDPARRQRFLLLNDELSPEQVPCGPHDVVGARYIAAEAPRATADDVALYRSLERDLDDDSELRAGDARPYNLLAEQSEGVRRLGVLRMDVDDLGDLFSRGLDRPAGLAALAVTAALSAALARFFEGWVGELCRRQNREPGGGVYAIYSGGDDLFLVGSWDRMPILARRIREDFVAYALGRPPHEGEHPPISLSAGIVLVGARYPLYQAADDAATALDQAKTFTRADGRAKDAITFLGRTLGWEQFDEAERFQRELTDLVQSGGAPRALLMTIQQLDAGARRGHPRTRAGEPQFAFGPWIWRGAYQLTRLVERSQSAETKRRIEALRERLVGPEGVRARTIERAGLAARWSQLRIRERG
ncbi:MAG: type III-A CRISPR-associated protein Cas10/Csm1 [Chloroflexaceae bacterium]